MTRYCHSEDNEEFSGDFATREEAADEGSAWTAEVVPATELLKVWTGRIDRLVEDLDEDLGEIIGGNDPLIELDAKATAELAEIVRKFLVERATFPRHGIKDIQRVTTKEIEGER